MMRVVSGIYKSRILKSRKGEDTRPTLDQIKEAVFNSLANCFENKKILDLFAGSGQIAIECISRGASECFINDFDKQAIKTITSNLDSLSIKDYKLMNLEALTCLRLLKNKHKFALIYLDPPFKFNKYDVILEDIYKYNLLDKNGKIVIESDIDSEIINNNFKLFKSNIYGKVRVRYYE